MCALWDFEKSRVTYSGVLEFVQGKSLENQELEQGQREVVPYSLHFDSVAAAVLPLPAGKML